MTDYTAEIAELQAAYTANRVANATIATDVRSKYRAIIAEEIRVRREETDKKFADHLALVKERADLPLHVIQDHVLHTKAWNRWTYWRDLANIEPERVTIQNAREAREIANRPYRWSEDFNTMYWLKDRAGKPLKEEIVLKMDFKMLHIPDHLPEQRAYIDSVFGAPAVLKKLAEEAILEKHGKPNNTEEF